VPSLAMGGDADPRVSTESLENWKTQTSKAFALEVFAGDHFYLAPRKDEVIARIQRFLNTAA
jgi:surfactin synthase thioesterase subunit